jgi:excisionase family DNA binding protein
MRKDEMLKPREAARALGIRLDSIYSAIWAGKLTAKKLDGRWLIPLSEIEEKLRNREARNGGGA